MIEVEVKSGPKIDDYKSYGSLAASVDSFLEDAEELKDSIKNKTIWMVNSTRQGGGVAEMLPSQLRILAEIGVSARWLVLETDNQEFFELTKRIHNGIHGSGTPSFDEQDEQLFKQVNQQNAMDALEYIRDGDIVVVHDPQPAGLITEIKKERDITAIWRCHIGLEGKNESTDSAWSFLRRYLDNYDHYVFSIPAYVPDFILENYSIIPPAIDPLSHKNRTLSLQKCTGILHQSGIITEKGPFLYDFYQHQVQRVQPDGSLGKVDINGPLDIIYRPTVTQISRWDRLKGFFPLMQAFVNLKQSASKYEKQSIHHKRLKQARLILGGPDPEFVKDDPEGIGVLNELIEHYQELDKELQEDIAILLLPMDSAKHNALIVNAIQRSSSIIAQNSLQEGFGLTATEAMWKQIPILVSDAAGLRFQVQDEINGKVIANATDTDLLSNTLDHMLSMPKKREKWAFNGQLRVIENFTVFSQLYRWLKLLSAC